MKDKESWLIVICVCVCGWGCVHVCVSFKTRERELSFFVLFLKEIMSTHMRPCIEHDHHDSLYQIQMIECD